MSRLPEKTIDEGTLRFLGALRIGASLLLFVNIIYMGSLLWEFEALPPGLWVPISLGRLLGGMPSRGYADLVWFAAAASTLLMAAGFATRWSTAVAAVSVSVLGMLIHSFGKLYHNSQALVLLFIVMALSDWGHRLSVDAWLRRRRGLPPAGTTPIPWPNWNLKVFLGFAGLLYFSSGFMKVYFGEFLAPGQMQRFLATRQQLDAFWNHEQWAWLTRVMDWLIANPDAAQVAAWMAVLLELGLIITFVSDRFAVLAIGCALMFHGLLGTLTDLTFYAQVYLLIMLGTGVLLLRLRRSNPRLERLLPSQPVAAEPGRSPLIPIATMGAGLLLLLFVAPRMTAGLASGMGAEPIIRLLFPLVELTKWGDLFPIAFITGAIVAPIMTAWMGRDVWRILARKDDGVKRTLLYDADCGFCQQWVAWALKRGAGDRVAFEACQHAPEIRESAGIPEAQCVDAAFLVEQAADGTTSRRGAGAVNGVLELLPGWRNLPHRIGGLLYRSSLIREAEDIGYQYIAVNRHRLGDASCGIDGEPLKD